MPQTGAPSEPVDLSHLATYTGGDAALNAEVLQLFCDQSATLMCRLLDALDARDQQGWQAVTHSLKGAARGIGAFALADAAADAEPGAPGREDARRAQSLSGPRRPGDRRSALHRSLSGPLVRPAGRHGQLCRSATSFEFGPGFDIALPFRKGARPAGHGSGPALSDARLSTYMYRDSNLRTTL